MYRIAFSCANTRGQCPSQTSYLGQLLSCGPATAATVSLPFADAPSPGRDRFSLWVAGSALATGTEAGSGRGPASAVDAGLGARNFEVFNSGRPIDAL